MSREKKSSMRNHSQVIVRAYGDEPVRLHAVDFYPDCVEVFGQDPAKSIRYLRALVFRDDEALFEQLSHAFSEGAGDKLVTLWASARRV